MCPASSLWRIGAYLSLLPSMHRTGHWQPAEGGYILALSVISETLALLTLGLVRPWGEVFPRWLPGLPGHPVPRRVAVAAAAVGVVGLTVLCGWMWLNSTVLHHHFTAAVSGTPGESLPDHGPGRWLLLAAYLPLLAWAPLLAAVTVDYRRRGRPLARVGEGRPSHGGAAGPPTRRRVGT